MGLIFKQTVNTTARKSPLGFFLAVTMFPSNNLKNLDFTVFLQLNNLSNE